MKKKLVETISRIGLGIVDALPIIGTIKQNIAAPSGGEGKIDIVRLVGAIATTAVTIGAIYLFAQGKLTFEQLQELVK